MSRSNIYRVETTAHACTYWVADKKLYSRETAIKESQKWESIADTIGGRARMINTVTGQHEQWW